MGVHECPRSAQLVDLLGFVMACHTLSATFQNATALSTMKVQMCTNPRAQAVSRKTL